MKVVITGGAGFIGSHLAEALAPHTEVTVIDDLTTGKEDNLTGLPVRFSKGSILDLDLLHAEFSDASCIFHLAAYVSVPGSIANPLLTHEINVSGTLNVLLAARDAGAEKVVFASSAAVYGSTPDLPKQEDMPVHPESPYAVSKLAGEYYCRMVTELYDLPTVCLRYFNVYGPRQDPHSPYAAVIPSFVIRLKKKEPLTIYGDGEQTRDFVFVKDVVQANLLAMDHDITGTYNIASGTQTSINDIARTLQGIIGVDQKLHYEPPRPGDVRNSLAEILKAQEAFGFWPRFTLRQGLEEMIACVPRSHTIL